MSGDREIARARSLRLNSSDAERKLWSLLRNRGFQGMKFVRQFPVGPYFVDFACREAALVIEVDGGQHSGSQEDVDRTKYLNAEGYSVLRFWNNEILQNLDGVYQTLIAVRGAHPSPDWRYAPAELSPEGRGTRGENAATRTKRSGSPDHLAPQGERSARSAG